MTTITKALVGTVAAGAMAMAAAAPASAQIRDRDYDRGDGISAGEVIAGAVILGGLAAVIASADNDRDDYYDRDYRDNDRGGRDGYRYNNGRRNNARVAVEECVRAAEQRAEYRSGSSAEVYEVGRINRSRNGFEINGRIAVRNDYRGRGWGGDYRRNYRNNGWDEGRFSCDWRNGRVADIDFGGLRSF
jgi:hypothetical protein